MASIEVIEGIKAGDAVGHGLDVFGAVGEGFSAQETDLFFGGEFGGHRG